MELEVQLEILRTTLPKSKAGTFPNALLENLDN